MKRNLKEFQLQGRRLLLHDIYYTALYGSIRVPLFG
jgi:hypothetical protein